jgi:hypothetical protein
LRNEKGCFVKGSDEGFKKGNQFGKKNKGRHPVNEFNMGHAVAMDVKRRESEARQIFLKTLKGQEWLRKHSVRHRKWCKTPRGKETAKKAYLAMLKVLNFSLSGEGYFFNTPSEKEMKRCLKELGIYYEFQYFVKDIKHNYYADFYLPLYNIIIEVDGEVHPKKLDDLRTLEMEEKSYRVLRFKNWDFDARSVWREI